MIPRRPIRLVIGLTIAALFLPVAPTAAQSIKEDHMILHRNGNQPSQKGPAEWFTGTVRIDPLNTAPAPARHGAASVTFEPGARSAWHTHPLGQTLVATSGVGWTQCEGELIVEIRAGDVVWCPPGHRHWHGVTDHSHDPHRHPGGLGRQDGRVDGACDRRPIPGWTANSGRRALKPCGPGDSRSSCWPSQFSPPPAAGRLPTPRPVSRTVRSKPWMSR